MNMKLRISRNDFATTVAVGAMCLAFLLGGCHGRESAALSTTTSKDQSQSQPPTEISHTQIYASADGETHFREVVVSLTSIATAPPAQPVAQSELRTATNIRHAAFEPSWGAHDRDNNVFHAPSSRRFVSVRRGVMWVKASDGETRKFHPGDILEVLDVAPSKGHVTWAGGESLITLFANFE
jgi:hypothetical protein